MSSVSGNANHVTGGTSHRCGYVASASESRFIWPSSAASLHTAPHHLTFTAVKLTAQWLPDQTQSSPIDDDDLEEEEEEEEMKKKEINRGKHIIDMEDKYGSNRNLDNFKSLRTVWQKYKNIIKSFNNNNNNNNNIIIIIILTTDGYCKIYFINCVSIHSVFNCPKLSLL